MAIPGHVFVPYADMSLSPTFSLAETAKQTGNEFFTLAFIVVGSAGQPAWGGQIAADGQFLGDDITSLRGQGGDVIVSFGGATGTELAQATGDVATLQAQYQAVIDAYTLTAIDFDIEGAALADGLSVDRRNAAIAGLQSAAQAAGRDLAISYTLPVALDGLTTDGLNLLKNARAHGVNISLVNIMALDYGGSAPPGQMGQNAITAAQAVSGQLAGASWAAIGVTPMIGVNDTAPEVFTLQDAQDLLRFAQQNNLGRLAMWSVTRDQPCTGGPGGAAQATCSGVDQQPFDFTNTFKTFGSAKMSTPTPGQKYAIKSGDTLFSIATAAYGAANATPGVTAIETANPGLNPTNLQVGQQILIPVLGGTGTTGQGGGTGTGTLTPGQQYTIKSGDTLFSIATAAYGAANATPGVTAIETANPGLNPTNLQVGQQILIPVLGGTGTTGQGGGTGTGTLTPGQQYTIKSGDTLFSIATAAYGAANATPGVTAIETANPGLNPTNLQVGQQILIPVLGGTGTTGQGGGTGTGTLTPGQQYTIKSGDTLFSIATAAYGAANATPGVTAIETANPGLNPTNLQVGQQILIPVLGGTGTTGQGGGTGTGTLTPGQQYTIKSGDTLFSIATAAYGAANATPGVTAIETANPGLNPTNLQVGQQILIPVLGGTGTTGQGGGTGTGTLTPGQQYTIKSGDTLFSIATAAYGAANATPGVTAIETANPGLNPTNLQVGQQILIPVLGGTGTTGQGGGLTSDQIQAILAAHNSYRAQVGVPPLQWSDSLAVSSQNWANQLAATGTLVHSHGPYGENLADGTAGGFSVTQLVDIWGNEKQFFIAGTFPNVSSTGNWEDVGHYTQVVWKNTTQVGGALATGNGLDFLVCQYLPEGNVVGQAVF